MKQPTIGATIYWQTLLGTFMAGTILADEGDAWLVSRSGYGGTCLVLKPDVVP